MSQAKYLCKYFPSNPIYVTAVYQRFRPTDLL